MKSAQKRLKVSNSSSLSEVPSASISNLPNDVLKHCFSFIPGSYVTVAPVSRQFFSNYSTVGICDSDSVNSADSLLKIGKNRRTTADAVASDIKLTEYCMINEAPEEFMIKACQKAASKGRTDIIECAHILGIDIKKVVGKFKWPGGPENLIIKLAKEGNLEMLKYFDNRFPETVADANLRDWRGTFQLARDEDRNNVHVMKWIVEEKQKRQDHCLIQALESHEALNIDVTVAEPSWNVFEVASLQGNLEVLERCHRNNFQCESWALNYAIMNKDKERALETLKWLRRHGCPWDEESQFCEQAARNNNLEALKWARSEGCPWDEDTLVEAARIGNIAMLEYCLQNKCPLDAKTCSWAMFNEDHHTALEVLKTLRKYYCPWGYSWEYRYSLVKSTCYEAIRSGNYEAMFWAKRNGCPWTEEDFCYLVQEGHVSAIEEALQDEPHHDVNDRVHVNKIFGAALRTKSSHVSCIIEKLKLLRRYGYEWNVETSSMASKLGKLQVLQWLHYKGCAVSSACGWSRSDECEQRPNSREGSSENTIW
ncbi:hypothetical protein CTEN210_05370 [Chaetoceros tenuissimus]|uniref:Uncharacterized protein n=1 Tax=Chaetoceros tenuissimus TaxID=426638 RepID=A0AAD3CNC0_9STRA|nr:hypothetical protein CTEN210_05370 [Chaetoceros tenuissimus]